MKKVSFTAAKLLSAGILLISALCFFSCQMEPVVSAISVETMPEKVSYFKGDVLDLSGLVVHSVYSDGRYELIENFEASPEDGSVLTKTGKQKITITAEDKKTSFYVTVEETKLISLTVTSEPNKKNFTCGDLLNLDGLILRAEYNNGSIRHFTCDEVEVNPKLGTKLEETGNKSIVVRKDSQSVSIDITVQEKAPEYSESPVILNPPKSVRTYTGETVQLSVQTKDVSDGELQYQWYKAVSDDESFTVLDGQNKPVLEITNDGTESVSQYYVIIKNVCEGKNSKSIKSNVVKVQFIEAVKLSVQTKGYEFFLYDDPVCHPLFVQYNINKKGVYSVKWYKKESGKANTPELQLTEPEIIVENDDGLFFTTEFVIKESDFTDNMVQNYSYYSVLTEVNGEKSKDFKSKDIVVTTVIPETTVTTVYLQTNNCEPIVSKEDWLDAVLTIDDDTFRVENLKISVKGRGNTSWSQPKKPYAIKLKNELSMLGMPAAKRWVLVANYSDKSLLRNRYASYIGNNVFTNMAWNPSFKSVNLVLNGEYLGNYIFGEQIKIGENRVNIQDVSKTAKGKGKDVNNDGKVDMYDGGFVFEVNQRMDDDFNFKTKKGVCISLKDPGLDDFGAYEEDICQYIKDVIQRAEDSLFIENYKDADNPQHYSNYIDVKSFIDWLLTNEYAKNKDLTHWFSSVYLYYNPADGKIYLGPNWDYDISFGNYMNESYMHWTVKYYWIKQLCNDPAFITQLQERWTEIYPALKESISFVTTEGTAIEKSGELNFKRWNILGKYVWPNRDGYEERLTYLSEVNDLKTWLQTRLYWINVEIKKTKTLQ